LLLIYISMDCLSKNPTTYPQNLH